MNFNNFNFNFNNLNRKDFFYRFSFSNRYIIISLSENRYNR